MNLNEYLEFRELIELYGGDFDKFMQLNEDEKIEYLERIDEGWKNIWGGFVKTFGHILGGKKTILGKYLKNWGVTKKQVAYLEKQKKGFIRDLVGEDIDLDDEYILTKKNLYESYGAIQKVIRSIIERKMEIYDKYGAETIEDLDRAQRKTIRDIEKKITDEVNNKINELYKLKTKEVHSKIDSLNIADHKKYALKYLWEKMIVALKPKILSDLLEQNVIESTDLQDRLREWKKKKEKEAEEGFDKANKKIQNAEKEDDEGEEIKSGEKKKTKL